MVKSAPYEHLLSFSSLHQTEYLSFAKATLFHSDLYDDFVAPTLKTDLLTETWQHGNNNIGPSCSDDYKVEDIAGINIEMADGSEYSFYNSNDHSKFAIGKEKDFICIGDINRQVRIFLFFSQRYTVVFTFTRPAKRFSDIFCDTNN